MKNVDALKTVLRVKVFVTVVAWVIPLGFFSTEMLQRCGILEPPPPLFAKLLAAAFVALTVGYLQGLRDLAHNKPIGSVVRTGLVSNGLAYLILLFYGASGAWSGWPFPGPLLLWSFTFILAGISVGLFVYGWDEGNGSRLEPPAPSE